MIVLSLSIIKLEEGSYFFPTSFLYVTNAIRDDKETTAVTSFMVIDERSVGPFIGVHPCFPA
jgi:hypothetical protein